jgi:hypothetical protein
MEEITEKPVSEGPDPTAVKHRIILITIHYSKAHY